MFGKGKGLKSVRRKEEREEEEEEGKGKVGLSPFRNGPT